MGSQVDDKTSLAVDSDACTVESARPTFVAAGLSDDPDAEVVSLSTSSSKELLSHSFLDYSEAIHHHQDVPDHGHNKAPKKSIRKYLLASMCLAGMIATWLGLAEWMQDIESNPSAPGYIFKPCLETYFIHASYVVFLPFWGIGAWIISRRKDYKPGSTFSRFSFKRQCCIAVVFSAIQYLSTVFWYWSLPITTVASNTIIYQSEPAFVFLFSIFLLKDRCSWLKLLSVLISLGGVIIVVLKTPDPSGASKLIHSTTKGYCFVVVSMIAFAFFDTAYKSHGEHPEQEWPTLYTVYFLGTMGVASILTTWPVVLIAHYTGIEKFEIPTMDNLLVLFANGMLGFLFDALNNIGISCTSPLFISAGTMLIIPASAIVDHIVHKYIMTALMYLGIFLVIFGFFILTYSDKLEAIICRRKHVRLRDTVDDDVPTNELTVDGEILQDFVKQQECGSSP